MKIILNGKKTDVGEGLSIAEFMRQKKLDSKAFIVVYNHEVIEKNTWSEIKLENEDSLEILQFVGGG